MRFVLGFALTTALAAVLTSGVIRLLQPQIQGATSALTYLSEHWPNP
jgi:hypothetical protein